MRPTRCAVGSSRRSFTNALQAPRLFVVTGARVMAMGTQAAASVTGLDHDAFARDDDRALGQGIAALAQSRTLEAELPELDEAALRAVLR